MTDKATLTDATGLGGLIAQGGFDYQLFDALIRLPAWLADAAFEGFAIEMLEDVEARFVAPHAPHGHVIDRYQAKSAQLTRRGLVDVFKGFQKFAYDYPETTRAQILVTPTLPPGEAYLSRDPGRVRKARPFYAPFAGIQAASDEKLWADLVADFGESLGSFFADNIEVSLQPMADRGQAKAQFAASLYAAFPEHDLGAKAAASVFADLIDYAAARRGQWLTKDDLLAVIGRAAGKPPSRPSTLPVHVRSERKGSDPSAIEIDASAFSGGAAGYPPSDTWAPNLLTPLDHLHRWARATGHKRIALSGSYRLTTAFALGWAFRSAVGFEIDIPTREGSWPTDDRAEPEQAPAWTITPAEALVGDRLVVCIGSVRDPTADVRQHLGLTTSPSVLTAFLPVPVTDARAAQASVRVVRGAIEAAVKALKPAAIDLYVAGPTAFFVALGHRWNAMPVTQLHEFIARTRAYVPSALIPV